MSGAARLIDQLGRRRLLVLLPLGFASGLPPNLIDQTLQAWLTAAKVDLRTIGWLGLASLPYALKFLWAPLLDRFVPPLLGRRRGWLVVAQIGLVVALASMAVHDPARALTALAVNVLIIALLSASQDIVVDAYRSDVLDPDERGIGASLALLGYRLAMLVSGAVVLRLVVWWQPAHGATAAWQSAYLAMAGAAAIGLLATLVAPEPRHPGTAPMTLRAAVIEPFRDFASRTGPRQAIGILAFIALYKAGDVLAGAMVTSFLITTGFDLAAIADLRVLVGVLAAMLGTLAGGVVLTLIGTNRALWVFGVLQAASNLGYLAIALVGPDRLVLATAIAIENFCAGLVGAAFVAFLMGLCTARFSATQYALLTGLMALGATALKPAAGVLAARLGWPIFFLITIAAAVPGMLLLPWFAPWRPRMEDGRAR